MDYLAEFFRELRKYSFGDVLDRHFTLGEALNRRDEKAVRKVVSGFLKLLHPDEQVSQEELAEYLELALEFRRRVKEQLRRMGGVEYWNTALSFRPKANGQEHFVTLPEQGGGAMVPPDPLPPGATFTVGLDAESQRYALFRVEVALMKGSSYTVTGAAGKAMREAVRTAYDYLRSSIHKFTIERSLEDLQAHFQVVNLMQAKEGSETAAAFLVALFSALINRSVRPATVVIGEITVQGSVLPVNELGECVQLAQQNGARRVLIPTANARDIPHIPAEILSGLELAFYADPRDCLLKALEG